MKINFRKITSVLSCGIMAVSTIGFAAAASYPAPFVSGGSADVAIVYGTGSGVSRLDIIQAGNVQSNLQSYLGGTTTTGGGTTGGDSVKLEKASTKFQLGKGITDIIGTAITDDSPGDGLQVLLADGEYVDDDNDANSYTQKIDLLNATLTQFDDDDYKADSPTIGIRYASAANVLNYTLDFTDTPLWEDIDSTNIEIMGKDYFILSHTANTTINLLDAAQTTTLTEGETTTVNGHEVSISFIGGTGTSAEVKLNVDGEVTNSLNEGETQKLTSGDYVGIKDISVQDYAGGTKTVEFSIGTGKLVLKHNTDVEINDASISNMKTYITTTSTDSKIDQIVIAWQSDDEVFLAKDSEITMPGFEAVKLSFAGMLYPAMENIRVRGGSTTYITLEDFPLKDSTEDINVLYGDSLNFTAIGKDSTHLFRTSGDANGMRFDKDTDDWFLVSYNDGSDAESYLMRATDFGQIGTTTANETTIQYRKDGAWVDLKTDAKLNDVISVGNVEVTIDSIERSPVNAINVTTTSTSIEFDRMYSKEGMQVYVPFDDTTNTSTTGGVWASDNQSTFNLIFSEEDNNGNIGAGKNITAVLGWNSATTAEAYVSDITGESVTFAENGDNTKLWLSQVFSALATTVVWDKSGDQYEATLTYHGDESYGEVYLNAPSVTVTPGTSTTSSTQLGNVVVMDSEVSKVSSKNLVVVGGSCINTAAATLVGGAYCGSAWTTATGVGAGQFLLKGYASSSLTSRMALLVAGWEAADTVNAATYLRTQSVDTSKQYRGTSATSATLVVS